MNKKELLKKVERQTKIWHLPAITFEQKEEFELWLDTLERNITLLVYGIAPASAWADKENARLMVTLVGNNAQHNLPKGMYCLDLPLGIDNKYRDAFALAVIHFGAPPNIPQLLPELMSFALTKPTAHECLEGKMFIKSIIEDNKDKEDIVEWATVLSQ